MTEVLIRYLHFLGVIGLGATLVAEHLLLKREMTAAEMRRIALIDGLFGLSAAIALLAGLGLWLVVGEAAYYSSNWIFHLKLAVFVLIGLLSVWPTVFFLRHRKSTTDGLSVPPRLKMILRLELLLFLCLPLLATLMARGYGAF